MKQLPIPGLKQCPCVGVILYSLHGPSGFGEGAGPEVSTSHVFPKNVVAAIIKKAHRSMEGFHMLQP